MEGCLNKQSCVKGGGWLLPYLDQFYDIGSLLTVSDPEGDSIPKAMTEDEVQRFMYVTETTSEDPGDEK